MPTKQQPSAGRLALDHLTLDPQLQARELKTSVVNTYLDAMRRNAEFPPITVVRDEKDCYYLVDGHHRVAARKQLPGIHDIAIKIIPGTFADALWLSWGVNRDHGLPRTQEAKRNAIRAALRHPEWSKKSDRVIAKHIGCDHKTIGSFRRRIQAGEFPTPRPEVQGEPAPSKNAILNASRLLARMLPTQESEFAPTELLLIRKGHEAVHRLLFGAKTSLPPIQKVRKTQTKVTQHKTRTTPRRVK